MGSLSNYAERAVLDHVLKTAMFTPPAITYVGLSTSDPLEDGSGVIEPSGAAYARQPILFTTANNRSIIQSTAIEFPAADSAWGTITHFAIFDSSTGGNVLASGALVNPKYIDVNNSPTISYGSIVLSISPGGMSTNYANKVLDWLFSAKALAQPVSIYCILTIVDIIDSDDALSVSEFSMSGYARTSHNDWNAASGDLALADNIGEINFGTLTGTGQTIAAVALVDVLSGPGDILFYDSTINQSVADGTLVRFLSGDFNCTLD